MAINPRTKYPNQTVDDANYTYGKARNITSPGDGTGTPWEEALINDIFGFQQALLDEATVVPSGDADTASSSQYLTATNSIIDTRSTAVFNTEIANIAYTRNFDTLAAMVADANLAVGDIARIHGRSSIGDGGSNTFEIVASGTGTVDGGRFIDLTGSGHQAKGLFPGGVVRPEQFGATGDGTTDDTAAIQNAVDFGTHILFQDGTYIITSVKLDNGGAGKRLQGVNASLKQAASQPNSTFMLDTNDTRAGKSAYSGAADSQFLTIDGLDFDGNRANQGPYDSGQLFLCNMVNLAADSGTTGRLQAFVTGCTFHDGVGSGVTLRQNTTAYVSDCSFNEMFLGSVRAIEYTCTAFCNNLKMGGLEYSSPFLLAELVAAGSDPARLYATNCECGAPPVILTTNGEADFNFHNCRFEDGIAGNEVFTPFLVSTGDVGNVVFSNCYIAIGNVGGSVINYRGVYFESCEISFVRGILPNDWIVPDNDATEPGTGIKFSNCRFTTDGSFHDNPETAISTVTKTGTLLEVVFAAAHGITGAPLVLLAGFDQPEYNGAWVIQNNLNATTLRFRIPDEFPTPTVTSGTGQERDDVMAIRINTNDADYDNVVYVDNCYFSEDFNFGVYLEQGGRANIDRCLIDSAFLLYISTANQNNFDVTIGPGNIYDTHMKQFIIVNASWDNGSKLRINDAVISSKQNLVLSTANINFLTYEGKRTVLGSGAPNSTDGAFVGDRFLAGTPTASTAYEYIQTVSTLSGSVAASTWKVLGTVGA